MLRDLSIDVVWFGRWLAQSCLQCSIQQVDVFRVYLQNMSWRVKMGAHRYILDVRHVLLVNSGRAFALYYGYIRDDMNQN